MKNTKGNWYRKKRGDTYRVETDKEHIAHCYGLTHECGANAKLLASAPELLECLQDLVTALGGANGYLIQKGIGTIGTDISLPRAKEAISKATT